MTTNQTEQVAPTPTPTPRAAVGLDLDRNLTGMRGVGQKPFLKPRNPDKPPGRGSHPECLLD